MESVRKRIFHTASVITKHAIKHNKDINNISSMQVDNVTVPACRNDMCVSDEDYMEMLHDYVYPSDVEWVLICLYIIVFIVGLTGK